MKYIFLILIILITNSSAVQDCCEQCSDIFTKAVEQVEYRKEVKTQIQLYIHSCNAKADSEQLAEDFISICYDEYNQNPWMWVFVAKFESTFNVNARGAAGERGLVQIHPTHKKKIAAAGLDYSDYRDQLRFGCIMFQNNYNGSPKKALSPWTVRSKAMNQFKKIVGESLSDSNVRELSMLK